MTSGISRRHFLRSAAATATVPFLISVADAADTTVIDVMTDGDSNVSDWWTNTLAPMFEKANPGLSLNVVITRANGANDVVAQRVVAAMQAKADPKVDYFEEFDPRNLPGAVQSGAFEPVDAAKIPNFALVNPLGKEIAEVIPYRASQVLLAYDGAKVPATEVPRTFPELVAWIKAHPGEFIYGRPDKGGSGKNLVVRAVHEANGRDPSLFLPTNFDAETARKRFAGGWEILKDLQASLYDKGAYPAGNNPTLQLFAGGAVSMITAWSDMALQGLAQGVLPETTKLAQLQDLPFCGGFAFSSIPSRTVHKAAAFKLADFMLSPPVQERMIADFGAFPGVEWKHLSPELAARYKDVTASSMPAFPGGDWTAALNDGWYANVATHMTRS
ncbi:extracellular solute-binding protein [Labrys wisconsinensis]|uniref:Spermidine/putrescine transport system substrate-binding protein n=1 Tax=Labrys wisconsinensis TaxID=425677 RepID=A0ABU0JFW1_9HYPH|nr:extracellular solute-binding protein [Labrys wisconsinensis]MDQ0472139.1 putative spermidine/putrescine transport system substrate-binding protein [Labrys wisconsinensis]